MASRSGRGMPFISRPNATFSSAVRQGKSWAKSWKTIPRSMPWPSTALPPMRISPATGARNPAMILRRVVLPQPLGPTMHRNSDASMLKLTSSTPGTRPPGVSYASVTWDISMCGTLLPSGFRRAHHAPANHGCPLQRAEQETLENETDRADHRQRREHEVGVQEFLGVEDHPAQPPIRGGDHLRAHDGDPGSQKCLAQARDDEGRSARDDHLPEERSPARTHSSGGAQPQRIDRRSEEHTSELQS